MMTSAAPKTAPRNLAILTLLLLALLAFLLAGPSSTADQAAPSDDTFVPSEKVPADGAVSFPVDI